jgi:hypothetical protein
LLYPSPKPQFEHPTVAAKPIATLALMEACRLREPGDSPEVAQCLAARAVNLKKSQHPIGRTLPDVAAAIGVGSCFSLGTAGPDTNPAWSIYQGMGEVFKFCQRRAPEKKSPRLKLKGLGILGSLGRGRSGSQPQTGGIGVSVASSASSVDGSAVMAPGGGSGRGSGGVGGVSTASSVASGELGGPFTAGACSSTATSCSYTSGPFTATESVDQVRALATAIAD